MRIRILSIRDQREAEVLMKGIGVDPGGIAIMAPKAIQCAVKISQLPNISANILKQEALSQGADAAVSRGALTGKVKFTDCLVIGNLAQLQLLCHKLQRQPYMLSEVAFELKKALAAYQKQNFVLKLGKYALDLSRRTHIMGILNVTSDSFSGDGLYRNARGAKQAAREAVEYAQRLVDDGADIIDVGGESSRPGAMSVSLKEELSRVVPVIKSLCKKIKVPVSIDTYKAEVARQALYCGASMINDITALGGDPGMARVASRHGAAIVLMHMKGRPQNMQRKVRYKNLVPEVIVYLKEAIRSAIKAGISLEKIIVDPGIGFGKRLEHNLEIIRNLSELKVLGRPILVGVSRKSFIGSITGGPVSNRVPGTISSNCFCAINGAAIVRVHDVKEAKESLSVLDSILRC